MGDRERSEARERETETERDSKRERESTLLHKDKDLSTSQFFFFFFFFNRSGPDDKHCHTQHSKPRHTGKVASLSVSFKCAVTSIYIQESSSSVNTTASSTTAVSVTARHWKRWRPTCDHVELRGPFRYGWRKASNWQILSF